MCSSTQQQELRRLWVIWGILENGNVLSASMKKRRLGEGDTRGVVLKDRQGMARGIEL
jgi:hypothetical protein